MLKLSNHLSPELHDKRKPDGLRRTRKDRTASTKFGTDGITARPKVGAAVGWLLSLTQRLTEQRRKPQADRAKPVVADISR